MRSNYVKCEKCKQTMHENTFEEHRQNKKCTSMQLQSFLIIKTQKEFICRFLLEPTEGYERCPLCFALVNQNKWREHLMGDQPCINNPRSKVGKACKYTRYTRYT